MTVQTDLQTTAGRLDLHRKMLIDGQLVDAVSDAVLDVENPATGEIIGSVPAGDIVDVDRAVAAARRTFDAGVWRSMKYTRRAEILWRWAELVLAHTDELAELETLDNGMPLANAAGNVRYSANTIRYFAGICSKIYGRTVDISGDGAEFHTYSSPEPIGVSALIGSWNAPFAIACTKSATALAAGCSIVLKPAEQTPLSSLRLAELALEAGVPPGVFNVVTGLGQVTGAALSEHAHVDHISFTGSTAVGRQLIHAAAGNLKRLSLELGGKSPVFIFDDADIEAAIPIAAMGIFNNSGQICFAGSRLYVQDKMFDRVVAGIAEFAENIRLGDGMDPGSQLGPLVSSVHRARVMDYVASGKEDGAELVTGGRPLDRPGYFLQPAVFANTTAPMKIVREEIFGPVLSAARFSDIEQVAALGNATPYGLGAGIYTRDIGKAHRLAKQLRAGNVWINCYGFTDKAMPFGGFKQSGWGREGGFEGLDAFLEHKTVYARL